MPAPDHVEFSVAATTDESMREALRQLDALEAETLSALGAPEAATGGSDATLAAQAARGDGCAP